MGALIGFQQEFVEQHSAFSLGVQRVPHPQNAALCVIRPKKGTSKTLQYAVSGACLSLRPMQSPPLQTSLALAASQSAYHPALTSACMHHCQAGAGAVRSSPPPSMPLTSHVPRRRLSGLLVWRLQEGTPIGTYTSTAVRYGDLNMAARHNLAEGLASTEGQQWQSQGGVSAPLAPELVVRLQVAQQTPAQASLTQLDAGLSSLDALLQLQQPGPQRDPRIAALLDAIPQFCSLLASAAAATGAAGGAAAAGPSAAAWREAGKQTPAVAEMLRHEWYARLVGPGAISIRQAGGQAGGKALAAACCGGARWPACLPGWQGWDGRWRAAQLPLGPNAPQHRHL